MRVALVIEQGNTPILQSVVRDSATGLPTSAATVQCTITDGNGNPVAGQTWPATLVYVPGSQGVYRCALSAQTALTPGLVYTATFNISVNGANSQFVYGLDVQTPGQYNPELLLQNRPTTMMQRLQDAEEAYHQLIMGKGVASIKDQNGEEINYSLTNRAALAQYIEMLKRQLRITKSLRPAGVVFIDPDPLRRAALLQYPGDGYRLPWQFTI